MIDYFSLALTHALIILALVRLLARADLDREDPMDDTAQPEQEEDDSAQVGGRAQARRARRARRRGKGAGHA